MPAISVAQLRFEVFARQSMMATERMLADVRLHQLKSEVEGKGEVMSCAGWSDSTLAGGVPASGS